MTNSYKYKIKVRPGLFFRIVYDVYTPEDVRVPDSRSLSIPEAYARVLADIERVRAPHLGRDLPEKGRSTAHP
jgi:hypothetical protein